MISQSTKDIYEIIGGLSGECMRIHYKKKSILITLYKYKVRNVLYHKIEIPKLLYLVWSIIQSLKRYYTYSDLSNNPMLPYQTDRLLDFYRTINLICHYWGPIAAPPTPRRQLTFKLINLKLFFMMGLPIIHVIGRDWMPCLPYKDDCWPLEIYKQEVFWMIGLSVISYILFLFYYYLMGTLLVL